MGNQACAAGVARPGLRVCERLPGPAAAPVHGLDGGHAGHLRRVCAHPQRPGISAATRHALCPALPALEILLQGGKLLNGLCCSPYALRNLQRNRLAHHVNKRWGPHEGADAAGRHGARQARRLWGRARTACSSQR